MKIVFSISFIFFSFILYAQQPLEEYYKLTSKANVFFKEKEYSQAVSLYSEAFQKNNDQGKVKDRYAAACCWALLNNADSAFFQLTKIVTKGKYAVYFQIS